MDWTTGISPGLAPALALLADVLEDGLTQDNRVSLGRAGIDVAPSSESNDALLAIHQGLFGFAVPPFAGVFLGEEGLSGGVVETRGVELLRAHGLNPELAGASRGHVSGVLRTASLVARGGSLGALGSFIARDCLPWVPALGMAVRREGNEKYADLIDVAVILLLEVSATGLEPGFSLPDRDPALSDPATSVKDLAGYLTTHVFTGLYVGRGTVRRLSRQSASPSGFGGRALMLANLLKSAASYGEIDGVLDGLREEVQGFRLGWTQWEAHGGVLAEWSQFWKGRLDRTERVIDSVRTAVSA